MAEPDHGRLSKRVISIRVERRTDAREARELP
jgi:hypothetical protein